MPGSGAEQLWDLPPGATAQCAALPYTYTTVSYTFHTETVPATGPCNYLPDPASATGLDLYCPSPTTITVKDPTPAGATDTGNGWTTKNPAPAGWSDDGTQYVSHQAKQARTVLA